MSVRQKIQRNKAKSQSFEYSPLHWLFDLKKKIKIFFWMWTVKKKSILNLLQYYFCFMVFCFFLAFWPQNMWDLSSPARGRTCASALKGEVLITKPPGKSLLDFSVLSIFLKSR